MVHRAILNTLFMLMMGFPVLLFASSNPFDNAVVPNWPDIAGADLIVVGNLDSYDLKTREHGGTIDIDITRVLKGKTKLKKLHVFFGTVEPPTYDVAKLLAHAKGNPVVALISVGVNAESKKLWYGLWGFGDTDVLVADTGNTEQGIIQEIDRERDQEARLATLVDLNKGGVAEQVQDAIDKMSSHLEFRRNEGVSTLLNFGCRAVPFIIMRMNDRRKFRGTLRLPNPPGMFEAYAQYTPPQVIDALSDILEWTVGIMPSTFDLDNMTNDEKDKQRQKVLNFWLVYLANHFYGSNVKDDGVWSDNCIEAPKKTSRLGFIWLPASIRTTNPAPALA